jgi:GNAT superfamily N-acetyltransferase
VPTRKQRKRCPPAQNNGPQDTSADSVNGRALSSNLFISPLARGSEPGMLRGMSEFSIRPAGPDDVPLILSFIREIAAYEKLTHEVVATEEILRESLFGARPAAEVLIGYGGDQPAAYAVFFHNFSTFLGRSGLYLEDLYVKPDWRGRGLGKAMLLRLARLAKQRQCGRFEWTVLDWNEPAIGFYKKLGASLLDEWKICRLTGDALDQLGEERA